MSSSRLTNRWSPGQVVRRGLAGWTLRARMLAALLAMLAVVCVIIGVFTTLAMRQLLIRQLDGQLDAAAHRSEAAGSRPPPPDDQPPDTAPFPPGQAAGTLSVLIVDGVVVDAAVLDTFAEGDRRPVPRERWQTL